MKTIIFFLILFCINRPDPRLGALTDADLDKIRLIVNDSEKRIKEEVKKEINALRLEFKTEITQMSRRNVRAEIAISDGKT